MDKDFQIIIIQDQESETYNHLTIWLSEESKQVMPILDIGPFIVYSISIYLF